MFANFMVNTWLAATAVAVVAGLVGFLVVVRGASFAAHALPLGTFPGAAAASLLGVNPLAGLVVAAAAGVVGITWLGRRGRHEVATALCLVMLLGLGALFLSLTTQYSQAVYALLFGQILGVSDSDLLAVTIVSAVCVMLVALLFHPLLLGSVSAELLEAQQVSSARMELVFLTILALATAVALPVVGALLVFSLMVGPACAARSLSSRPGFAALLSVVFALAAVWAAIALSYVSDWPVGFFVGAIGALLYGLGRVWIQICTRRPAARVAVRP
ncbi:metal ABC transporter permease [Burkholderia multivorans]|uniref:Metal ABC transporter permease n=1 Tax=Burkholderia multivorans TaxID=87883 RepID=A0AB37AR41_9BURK|nr:metal ABC transporter permease [Burkholderia multivorans]PRE45456.1 metal ABC transporter permease [Burkholderia multivorans]PRE52144.1 metal ABC transporter permease [Burkholderia multivorans]